MAQSKDTLITYTIDPNGTEIEFQQNSVSDTLSISMGNESIIIDLDEVPAFCAKIIKMYSRRASSGGIEQIFKDISEALKS